MKAALALTASDLTRALRRLAQERLAERIAAAQAGEDDLADRSIGAPAGRSGQGEAAEARRRQGLAQRPSMTGSGPQVSGRER